MSPFKSENHDMARVILLTKDFTNAVVTRSAFSITDGNSGNKALRNPGMKIQCTARYSSFILGENFSDGKTLLL